MSNWWEDAPLAEEKAGGNWWDAAPLADVVVQDLSTPDDPLTRITPSTSSRDATFAISDDLPRSVLDNQPARPGEFSLRRASAASATVDRAVQQQEARKQRERDFGTVAPIRGPEPSVESVARGVYTDVIAGGKNARAGISQMTADLTGSEYQAQQARKERGQADLMTAVNTPEFESDTARGIYSGLSSTVRQAPAIAAAVLTRNPSVALGGMVAPMVPDEYGKFRARGATPGEALPAALAMAGTEYITEKLPMGLLVDKFGKVGAGKLLAGMLVREVPGEQVATVVQDAIDTAVANPDKTWGNYLAERPAAAHQTLLATITQTGLMTGASAVARRMNGATDEAEPSAEQMARARGFLTPESKPAGPVRVEDQPTSPQVPSGTSGPLPETRSGATTPAIKTGEKADSGTSLAQQATTRIAELEAVDNIAQLLGQKAPDVSNPVGTAGQPAGSAASGSPEPAGSARAGERLDSGAAGNLSPTGDGTRSGEQAVAVGVAGAESGPVATLNESGTLTIKGEPQSIIERLRAGGVVSILPAKNGVMVGANQAEQALKLIQGQSRVQDQKAAPAKAEAAPAQPAAGTGTAPDTGTSATVEAAGVSQAAVVWAKSTAKNRRFYADKGGLDLTSRAAAVLTEKSWDDLTEKQQAAATRGMVNDGMIDEPEPSEAAKRSELEYLSKASLAAGEEFKNATPAVHRSEAARIDAAADTMTERGLPGLGERYRTLAESHRAAADFKEQETASNENRGRATAEGISGEQPGPDSIQPTSAAEAQIIPASDVGSSKGAPDQAPTTAAPAVEAKVSPAPIAPPAPVKPKRDATVVELRKRKSVLESIRKCLG